MFRRSADGKTDDAPDSGPAPLARYNKSMFIDNSAVLIGTLGEELDMTRAEVSSTLRDYHLKMAIARTWLDSARKENIYLFLVGPQGSASERRWVDIAYEIERNERVCRKLVWLPKQNEDSWETFADLFCSRVFPMSFGEAGVHATQELDPLGKVFGDDVFPPSWLEVLSRSPPDGDAVAERLVAVLDGSASQ